MVYYFVHIALGLAFSSGMESSRSPIAIVIIVVANVPFFLASVALSAKRLKDRERPYWLLYLFYLPWIILTSLITIPMELIRNPIIAPNLLRTYP